MVIIGSVSSSTTAGEESWTCERRSSTIPGQSSFLFERRISFADSEARWTPSSGRTVSISPPNSFTTSPYCRQRSGVRRNGPMKTLAFLALAFFVACGSRQETAQQQAAPPEAPPRPSLSNDQAGRVVQRAIDYHGGWDAWANKRTVQFKK